MAQKVVHRHGAHEPKLLIFDELLSGFFDPINANLLKEEIPGAARQGRHGDLLDAQHVLRGGDLRPHHAYQQIAQHPFGKVDDIRRRHGSNIFEVAYRGDEAVLRRLSPTLRDSRRNAGGVGLPHAPNSTSTTTPRCAGDLRRQRNRRTAFVPRDHPLDERHFFIRAVNGKL